MYFEIFKRNFFGNLNCRDAGNIYENMQTWIFTLHNILSKWRGIEILHNVTIKINKILWPFGKKNVKIQIA